MYIFVLLSLVLNTSVMSLIYCKRCTWWSSFELIMYFCCFRLCEFLLLLTSCFYAPDYMYFCCSWLHVLLLLLTTCSLVALTTCTFVAPDYMYFVAPDYMFFGCSWLHVFLLLPTVCIFVASDYMYFIAQYMEWFKFNHVISFCVPINSTYI